MCLTTCDLVGRTQGREVLPKNAKPVHYNITLEPDFETFEFLGDEEIEVDVIEDSSTLALNSLDIEIHQVNIMVDSTPVSVKKLSYDADTQTTTFHLDEIIPGGHKAIIYLCFTGKLNDLMNGFYRASYDDADGELRWLAATQFEATGARRAFPCFDEPALKASFTITLIADYDLTCLSNMDVAEEYHVESTLVNDTRRATRFNKTPVMSTYIVALAVGDFSFIETRSFRVPIRVYCAPNQNVEHGRFSLDIAARALALYEEQFAIKFPLPKMDMIGIPTSVGAMENWGLIIYHPSWLFLDPEATSPDVRRQVAETVLHELAHQWFGNLVTMEFWDGLWLNEGFARWMQFYACAEFFPEWKSWQTYVSGNFEDALNMDGLRSSHPVEVPITRLGQINAAFDAISYDKGSSVIRMIAKYLGERVFFEGLQSYLKKHAYGNATTADLWAALAHVSGKDVHRIASTWTTQIGHPVVEVQEDLDSEEITLAQHRFLQTGDATAEEDSTLFPIILGLRTTKGTTGSLMLEGRRAKIRLPDADFYKLNADHTAIFRTLYPSERLAKLGRNIMDDRISVEDRAGLVSDVAALSSAGYQKTSDLLSLLQHFTAEPTYAVWHAVTTQVSRLRAAWILQDPATQDALRSFQTDLVRPHLREIGWDPEAGDGHLEQFLKAALFRAAATAGAHHPRSAAFDMFTAFTAGDRTAIPPYLRTAVYTVVLQYGSVKEYNALLHEYQTAASTIEEADAALQCLGCASDPALMQQTLRIALDPRFHQKELSSLLAGFSSHAPGIEARWRWVQQNWDALGARFGSAGAAMTIVVNTLADLASEPHLRAVQAFFRHRELYGTERALAQALDAIRVKVRWVQRDAQPLREWLAAHGYLSSSDGSRSKREQVTCHMPQ